jgi:uncharacterized repeat protein (TIGR01451 family)
MSIGSARRPSMILRSRKTSVVSGLVVMAVIVAQAALMVGQAAAANPSANLDQCANDPLPSSHLNGCNTSATQWVNGNLGSSKSVYFEGDSIPYRMTFGNLVTGAANPHTVTIEWDTTKSSKHAIDYLTTWNRTVADANPCLGISGCSSSTTFPIPADPQVTGAGVTPIAGNFTLFGGTITSVDPYTGGAGFPTGDKSRSIKIHFTTTVANPVLAWGGHISTRQDWGQANSAVTISGSPYHMRLLDLDGSGGNQDRSLSADAVIFPGSITIVKDATPNGTTSFAFTASPSPLTGFNLVDDGTVANDTKVFSNITNFTTYSVAETPTTGWDLTGRACTVTSANGGSQTLSGSFGVSINLKEGENVTCTFSNAPTPAPALSITKDATESGFSAVGDVIHYTIVATNTGNTTLAAVTVTDPNASGLSCTPANGSPLAPSATMSCTASHTITQADIDAGSYYNQACVDDGTGGAAQACDDVTTPGSKNPHLSITKTATESGFSAVGDVIHYTVVATNDGNVTLAAVTVTDPNASGLSCTPANGSPLAPSATMSCTASHTITQADLDAGTYFNQACVDDGANGAAQACDDVTTPGTQNPHLAITKSATESGFSAVGDVIHYTITATNDGNVTLAAVTVTDPNASGLSCTPANGSSLAPGASLSCTASHTITQADIDAGSYYNQACVDDGANGAAEACDDVTTPGTQSPALSIDKSATESGFSAVGDIIHYTIVATNTGNTTLAAVTVTDPNASGLSCTPANGSSLAPGATMNCSASHTITQADLDAGTYYNQACVDDGAGGATQACDDVTTPGTQNPALSIDKSATETGFSAVGDVIHYTIVATNTGNVTLAAVTVTDSQVSNLSCTPANGSPLAPLATMSCTASHTITQADIDAGSFYNQACVDDGANGAAQACDDVTTPGTKNPHLAITKDATETGFDSVGDIIHYTITATNDGNTTLASVTVTDSQVSDLSCTPANGSSLAPGASLSCTASHTITQADIDAGSFYNQACVDDGANGAASACDDVTTPGTQNDVLTLTKTDDLNPAEYDHVGQIVTYTLTATNSGNTTLHNVNVSDSPALDSFTCTPAIPAASLDPGASIVCTGTHTITQADLTAGSFTDTASATSTEDDAPDAVDTVTGSAPAPVSQITPTATTCAQFKAGTAGTLSRVDYSVKNGNISQVSPGVFFYWVTVTSSGTYTIDQTITTGNFSTKFTVASGSAAYNSSCTKVSSTITQNSTTGAVTVTFAGSGSTFFIGIKYSTGSVVGHAAPSPGTTVHYDFSTQGVAGSTSGLDLKKKGTP